jgi:UDP-4-amino-4,6-dideoxy-N-acetyl-beta-L-altrosamine transaminase
MIPYGKQHITQEDIDAVVQTLTSDFLTQGPKIHEFETAFASYVGSKYAVAVSNGTAALHCACMALNLKPKKKVITTPITFAASANCIEFCGAEVLFADIDPHTYLIDLNCVETLCKNHADIVGIIPVDFAGYPIHAEQLHAIANKYKLWIIEDACHAPGGSFTDSQGTVQLCGNGVYADISIFSFHPVKHIATGEGGMLTTNNKEVYNTLCMLRTHGITKDPNHLTQNDGGWYYEMQQLGYNYRITDMQCALGISQLSRAQQGIQKRQEIALRYNKAFSHTSLTLPFVAEGICHAYHLYVIHYHNRKGLYDFLRSKEIYTQVHYIPVHTMPYYKARGHKQGDCPHSEAYYSTCLSLPMYPSLTEQEQQFVIDAVLEYIQ